jgi:hypothetical protein
MLAKCLLKTFQSRNVTNDTELDNLANQVSALIHPGMDIDVLRKDDAFKASILAGVSNLGQQLTALVEEIPGRKFKESL